MDTIVRRSPPTPWDHAPKDTLCRVETSKTKTETKTDIYIQRSPNENIPQWELLHTESEYLDKCDNSELKVPKLIQEMKNKEQEILELCSGISTDNLNNQD